MLRCTLIENLLTAAPNDYIAQPVAGDEDKNGKVTFPPHSVSLIELQIS
jgi:hypothetical protein